MSRYRSRGSLVAGSAVGEALTAPPSDCATTGATTPTNAVVNRTESSVSRIGRGRAWFISLMSRTSPVLVVGSVLGPASSRRSGVQSCCQAWASRANRDHRRVALERQNHDAWRRPDGRLRPAPASPALQRGIRPWQTSEVRPPRSNCVCVQPHHTASVRDTVAQGDVPQAIGRSFQAVREALAKQGVEATASPFVR